MESKPAPGQDPAWMLRHLIEAVDDLRSCVLVSVDGIPIAVEGEPAHVDSERLTGLAAGFASLANSGGLELTRQRGFKQVVTVFPDDTVLVVNAAGYGAVLAAYANPDADIELIGYQMDKFIKGVRPFLATRDRPATGTARHPART